MAENPPVPIPQDAGKTKIPIKSKNYIFASILILLLGLLFVMVFQLRANNGNSQVDPNFKIPAKPPSPQSSPSSPSPFPFEELTIPYLRAREFKSRLGELQKVSTNASFTSYFTSYESDGLRVNGLLTIPNDEKPQGGWPAIVFMHGYIPPKQYKTLERYADHVNYLARNGFVVFKIDLRGHGDSEGEPGGGYFSSDYVIDVLNARAALQSSNFVNPEKVGLWGHSMAGNVTLRAMAARPEIPSLVIWSGAVYSYTDMSEYGINDNSYQPLPSDSERQKKRALLRQAYGDPKDGNPFWKLVAPTSYLHELKGAIQLNHAVNDDVVDIRYSRNLNTLLDLTSISHELKEYSSGGHNIDGSAFTQAMQNTVEFYNKYLK